MPTTLLNTKSQGEITVLFIAVHVVLLVLVRGGGRLCGRKEDSTRLCLVHLPLIFCLGNYTWNWESQEHLQSHTPQISKGTSCGHTHTHTHTVYTCTRINTLGHVHAQTHSHINWNRPFFLCILSLLRCPSSLPPSAFLFPPTGSVSIRCDIRFGFLITSLCFVLLQPNNFIDDGHESHIFPVRNCMQAQTQIHGLGFQMSTVSLTIFLPLRVTGFESLKSWLVYWLD